MAQEIELKLGASPETLRKVAELPWLRETLDGPVNSKKLISVYFDTPKLKLRSKGIALRVRHIGDKRVQTIKVIHKGGGGPLGRGEWEQEIGDDTPDLALAKGTALEPLITKRLRCKLRPVFETDVKRMTMPVCVGGSTMEIALDRGRIKAGRQREPISEVEIELKHGDPSELTRIAERLAASLPLAYHPRPKQDRGYALLTDAAAGSVGAAAIVLDPECSTAEAFRVIALACLDHALANEQAVRARDAEGIHQMRVGLRRLRAALSLFKEIVQGSEAEAVKTELKWLTDRLGPARELDVLIDKRVRPARATAPFDEIGVLARYLDGQRAAAFDEAAEAVDSDRYRAIGLKTALWIVDGPWSRSDDPMIAATQDRRATDFVAEMMAKRLQRILKRAAKVQELSPLHRHKLRIAVKKLRYATEFFATLFPGSKREERRQRFSTALKAVQSALGTLNDLEAHKRIAGAIAHPRQRQRKQPQKALAIGFITGQEQMQTSHCLERVGEAANRFGAVRVFWK